MRHFRKTVLSGIAIATAAAGIAVAAYPEKTINYIIAFGPGGESDVSARLQEPFFKKLTGQTVANTREAMALAMAQVAQIRRARLDAWMGVK